MMIINKQGKAPVIEWQVTFKLLKVEQLDHLAVWLKEHSVDYDVRFVKDEDGYADHISVELDIFPWAQQLSNLAHHMEEVDYQCV